jgi:8-oxoguanine deaminase
MLIGGRWRVIDGQIEGLDLAQLIADHRQAARELIGG